VVDGTAAQPLATRIAILNSLTLAEPGGGWQSRARRGAHREPLSRWQFSAARHTVRAGRISVPGGRAPCTQSAALAPAPLVSTAARALPCWGPGSKILLATPGFEGFQPPRKPLWDTVGAQSLTAARNVWAPTSSQEPGPAPAPQCTTHSVRRPYISYIYTQTTPFVHVACLLPPRAVFAQLPVTLYRQHPWVAGPRGMLMYKACPLSSLHMIYLRPPDQSRRLVESAGIGLGFGLGSG